MITIPHSPDALTLHIDRLWNGTACSDDRLWATLELSLNKQGVHVRTHAPLLLETSAPDAPMGTRVDGLWNFDVVELFLVGPGHQYLELELGAGGHFLVLSFDSIRRRANSYEAFHPVVRFEKTAEKQWTSEMTIPWSMVPENLRALNAFAIMAGQFLAYEAVPGTEPDFHQPDFFPAACF
ncbi:hypothetical protein HY631_04915 [Candidatus Uhrbacteria bacterium]|nr:hypothetical protein [Candidatus Uhrbacteria bacterium]